MSELSPDAKHLIESGRASDAAPPGSRERIKARLIAELGAGAFAAGALSASARAGETVPAAESVSAGVVGTAWPKLAKLTATAAAAGALYAGVWLTREPAPTRPSEPARVSQRPEAPRTEPRTAPPSAEPPSAEPSVPAHESSEPVVERLARGQGKPPRPRRRAEPAERAEASPSLAAELALLARAEQALRAGRPGDALALAREHEARFPRGALEEERQAVDALARCLLGQGTASARAFVARWPASPLAARVRKECLP